MPRVTATPRRSGRRGLVPAIAGLAAAAAVVTLAVVVDGYDAQEVPTLASSVWVTRDAGQYARVNTELAEIDTVRAADDPSGVVQAGDNGMVFTQGFGRAWPIDAANPGDLGGSADPDEAAAEGPSGEPTPSGTREVLQAGDWVAYRTDTGKTYLGGLPVGDELGLPSLVDPFRDVQVEEGEEPPSYVADAIAVDDDGLLALYSIADAAVRLYDAGTDSFRGRIAVVAEPAADARLELVLAQGRWALFDATEGLLWLEGRAEPVDTGLAADAVAQLSSTQTDRVHLADAQRLVAVDPRSGAVEELARDSPGTPARPTVVAGELVAAWVSATTGRLWTEASGTIDLEMSGADLEEVDAIAPVLRSNGDRAVLNETASGMLWRVPDGKAIPVDQWTLDEELDRDDGTIEVDDVAEQEPPVAVDDAFGVREGELVALPLLLNDHDPNQKDVLTIVPESLQQPGSFGVVALTTSNQLATVQVTGSGSASFTYTVTDGVSESAPATVQLTVVGGETNSAPEWCGVDACQQEWPSPGISAGGTVTVPVLSGWVDPEGDVFVLSGATAENPDAPVTVVATAGGDVVVRHQDPNASDAVIPITVTVTDVHGATATRTLEIRVTGNPALVAEPIAAVAGVDELISVDISKHVRGGSGSFAIVDAVQTSATGDLVVVPNPAGGRIDLTAGAAGDYMVSYTVQDLQTLARQSALLRLTVVGAAVPLAIAPITAFVRANEDTTVDVLAAVQNTSGRVLIVSEATASGPALSVSVVAQSRVRVSGTTADGEPGRVGTATVTVTDGAGGTARGTVTVFLVAPETATGPIAVPDTATVRAGGLADILVLDNDVSPRGERMVVHPDFEGSGTAGELAFVAGDRVRYLAPAAPGVYTLRYSVFLENTPHLLDSATVSVTVLPPGANRAPQPTILTARVVAGQSVAIPFSGSGIDPDGDRVVLADVTQPESGQGIAEISAEGDTIVYTAPGNGVAGGQVGFTYRVRDAAGATAEGIVRIGVLAADVSDVAPVTYGDYVRVQARAGEPLTVAPLLNDRDPLQGALELQSVVPNAPAGSVEYSRLERLLDTERLAAGEVEVLAGDVLGVHSYVYTVVSGSSFSTAEGLIVVNVTDAPSPDAPLVTDTVVTAENRGELESGLDVVTGKVQWASGDPAGLELAIWGDAASDYTVVGRSIAGSLPADGGIVPFSLSGVGPGGADVVAYGFLRIPAFDDMRIQLHADVEAIAVPEEQARDFVVRDLLDLDRADVVEIRDDDGFAVQRAGSSCASVSQTRVEYRAGRGAPWSDTCTVPVRIAGQSTWTLLGIPVLIEPKDPQPILSSLSRTIAPGGADTIDPYADMTSWEGGRVGDTTLLDYEIGFSGSAFIVTERGDGTLQIDVRADARPGTRESIRVSVAAYGGLTAGISLVVGVAPPDAPRGAVFRQQCDVSDGASCAITVVDRAGEYDPFDGRAGSGLTLVSVGSGGSEGVGCAVATVRVGDTRQVVATWPAGPKPAGGECLVPYTVADAQGRTGQGLLTLDVLGYPQRPASVVTTGYTGTSVTLRVDLGDARNAHPAVTGVRLYEGGAPVPSSSCSPAGTDYSCTVSALDNGEQHSYTARAVNSVGESLDTTGHQTSAYARPEVTALSYQSLYRPGRTTTSNGVVEIRISAGDDAQSFRIVADDGSSRTVSRSGSTTTAEIDLAPGMRNLQVVPISRFSPPIDGTNEGDAAQLAGVRSVGLPTVVSNGTAVSGATGTSVRLKDAAADPNNSAEAMSVTYYVWQSGTPSCTANAAGDQQVSGALRTSTSPTVGSDADPLPANQEYYIAACFSYGFGAVATQPQQTFTFVAPPAPSPMSYSIRSNASGGATKYFGVDSVSSPDNRPSDFQLRFQVNGGPLQSSLSDLPHNPVPTVIAVFCKNIAGEPRCGPSTTVTPASGGPLSTVQVLFPDGCPGGVAPAASAVQVSPHAAGKYSVTRSESGGAVWLTFTYTLTWNSGTGMYTAPPNSVSHSFNCPFPEEPDDPEDPEAP